MTGTGVYRKHSIEPATLIRREILAYRNQLGLSQVQLDCEIGLEIGATGQVERGDRPLSHGLKRRYAATLSRLLDKAADLELAASRQPEARPANPVRRATARPALGVSQDQRPVRVAQQSSVTRKPFFDLSKAPSAMEEMFARRCDGSAG